MTTIIPDVELDVLKVVAHKLVQFVPENVLVHLPVKNEESKLVFHSEQSALVLSARQSEKADLGVLS